MKPGHDSERGSGTVMALGVIAVLMILMGLVHTLSAVGAARTQAAAAGDLAALAAADAARGLLVGDPCSVAEDVAAANEATLEDCTVGGAEPTEVWVVVSRPVLAGQGLGGVDLSVLRAYSTSRAGPPEALP